MSLEARPGAWGALFAKLEAQAQGKGREALTGIALVLEKQAKINASAGAHKYGTPTPATPGSGPAVISGNLRRAITHSPIEALGPGRWQTKVGTAVGFTPPYGGHHRTPANKYGYYLEHGLRNGATYPFLMPAFRHATGPAALAIYRQVYGPSTWKRVD